MKGLDSSSYKLSKDAESHEERIERTRGSTLLLRYSNWESHEERIERLQQAKQREVLRIE